MFTNMNREQLAQHITILGWLLVVSNLILALIGGLIFLLLTGIGAASGEAEALAVLSVVGIFVAGLMLVLALPGIAAGYGVLRHANWGRILAIVVAILSLLCFPIGTMVGLYALWVLLQESAPELFNGTTPTQAATTEKQT